MREKFLRGTLSFCPVHVKESSQPSVGHHMSVGSPVSDPNPGCPPKTHLWKVIPCVLNLLSLVSTQKCVKVS